MAAAWHATRAALLRDQPWACDSDALLLAQDVGSAGAKRFRWCSAFAEYAERFPHGYEVLTVAEETPVWAYFDVEQSWEEGKDEERRAEEFTRLAVAAVLLHFGMTKDSIGTAAQVATSHRAGKASVHIKVNVPCTPAECRQHAHAVHADFPHIDLGVYGNFRCYRRLGCAKAGGTSGALKSWRGSSSELRDHLVRRHPDNPQPAATYVQLPLARQPAAAPCRSCLPSPEPSSDRARLMAALRRTGMGRKLRLVEALVTLSQPVRRPGEVAAYVDKRSRATCPFTGRVHRSNRGLLLLTDDGALTYLCMDADCAGQSLCMAAPLEQPEAKRVRLV